MVAMLGCALASEFWAWLATRLLLGFGSGAAMPAMRRIVIARNPERMGANLGRLASFDVAGFILGPLVAAALAVPFGVRAPFFFFAGLYLGVFVLATRLDLGAPAAGIELRGVLRALLARPAIQATLSAHVAFYMTVGLIEAIWAVLLRDHGADHLVDRRHDLCVHRAHDRARTGRWAVGTSTRTHSCRRHQPDSGDCVHVRVRHRPGSWTAARGVRGALGG